MTGPAVPVSAIVTKPDATTFVYALDAKGDAREQRVTVLGSQDGVAVVSGLSVGARVRVLPDSGVVSQQGSLAPTPSASR